MAAPELTITLLPAPEDAPARSKLYQHELRGFEASLIGLGLDVGASVELQESGVPETLAVVIPPYLGDFMIKFAATAGPALGTMIGAWLHARCGRKVRLKIGDIEAEAQSVEQVESLLRQAGRFQQQAQQKLILKP